MKKLIAAGIAAAIVLPAAFVAAQVSIPYVSTMGQTDIMQVIPNAAPQIGNQYATLTTLRAWLLGGNSAHSAAPVITACGTSPAVAGSDFGFRLTTGTATPTACTITFAQAYTAIPACTVVSQTAYATTTPAYTVSATGIALTQAATNSAIYNVVCVAQNGG